MFESVTSEDTRITLTVKAMAAFEDVVFEGIKPGFFVRRALNAAFLMDGDTLTALAEPYVVPMREGHSLLQVHRVEPDGSLVFRIWISTTHVTCVRVAGTTCTMWTIDACELPALLAQIVGMKPRDVYDLGPRRIPVTIRRAMEQCHYQAVSQILLDAALAYESAPEENAPVTPLSQGVRDSLWHSTLMMRRPYSLGERPIIGDSSTELRLYVTVPETTYCLQPFDESENECLELEVRATRGLMEWSFMTYFARSTP